VRTEEVKMKIPVKLLEDYENNMAGDIILVDSHEAQNEIFKKSIGEELTDDELDEFLMTVDEEVYEQLVTDFEEEEGEFEDYE
jgi:hypothetical protein